MSFCAAGRSLDDAANNAEKIFVDAAIASGLKPAPLVGLEVEADLTEQPRPKLPLLRRRRGAEAWTMPQFAYLA